MKLIWRRQNTLRVAIYSRKSKFTGKGESIENQIQLCKNYAYTHFNVKDEDINIYEDEGCSGGNTNRPQFQLLMKDVKEKKFDVLICYRLDRIARDVGDFADTYKILENNNISFISISERFDTSTPLGKAMLYISSVFAQLERDTITERIKDNMIELAKTGRWLGGITPTGYCSEEVIYTGQSGKDLKMCKLCPINEELEIVQLIFDKYIELKSLTKVEQFCIINNIKSKNGMDFKRYSIRFILSNPVYVIADKALYDFMIESEYDVYARESAFNGEFGAMAYNKTRQDKKSTGSRTRDVSEWIVSVGAHKGILPSEKWIKVQKMLFKNKSKAFRKVKNTTCLLSGILFCGNCGSYMRPKMGRENKEGLRTFYYMCEMKERSKKTRCDIKNVNGNSLDKMIIDEIKNMSEGNSDINENIQSNKLTLTTSQNAIVNDISLLEAKIKENEQSISNLVSSLSQGQESTASKYIIKQIEEHDQQNSEMKNRLLELKESLEKTQLQNNSLDVVKDMLSAFGESIDTVDVDAKRTFIKSIVDRIVWNGENIEMIMFGTSSAKKLMPSAD